MSRVTETAEPACLLERARGKVMVRAALAGGVTHVKGLAQSGCLRACFPRQHGGALEAVLVNTAGGVTDGDTMAIEVVAEAGADLVIATAAAERIYRARDGAAAAAIDVRLLLEAGARLAFLPQETILFDASALDRRTRIEMAPDAVFLGVEALVFGRAAHGETVRRLSLRDTIQLRRDGHLLLHDAIRLEGEAQALQARAGAAGARAMATLIYAAPDAAEKCAALRGVLAEGAGGAAGGQAGASCWNGVLVARFLAADAQQLRLAITAAVAVLRDGAPLPRVWNS